MKRKNIAVLLTALFLLLLCPTAARAEETAQNVVSEIALFVAVPEDGGVPPTEPGYSMTGGSEAYRVTDISWSPKSETFRLDVSYAVTFHVVPSPGYAFSGQLSASVNGAPAECRLRAVADPATGELSPYAQVMFAFERTLPEYYTVTVLGGIADVPEAKAGDPVSVFSGTPVDGGVFAYWTVMEGELELDDVLAPYISFQMPAGNVTLRAIYKEKEPDAVRGDVNGDGRITAADARLALRAAVSLENYRPGGWQFIAADVDQNSAITAADARKILRAVVGLEDPLLWE